MPEISVVIVNWNGRRVLPDCLGSLASQTFRDSEVVVVDNGSTDGSVEYIRENHPWVKTVTLPRNTGFAAGNNRGLHESSGRYVVTVNNDTVADPRFLEELAAVADAHPEAGMIAPRICTFDDPDVIDSTGIRICRDGMSRGANRGRRFSAMRFAQVEDILCPSACAALYRRSMIEQVGFFDDEFFAYCEDTDLGLRGRRGGWKALFARDAVILHKYSQTSGSFSPLKLYLVERNHYRAALKSLPADWLIALPFWTAVRYAEQARAVLSGSGSGGEFLAGSRTACISALMRGMRDALLALPSSLAARRRGVRSGAISGREMASLLNRYRMTFRELLDNG
jgi:GT2 family glycosyltransferase